MLKYTIKCGNPMLLIVLISSYLHAFVAIKQMPRGTRFCRNYLPQRLQYENFLTRVLLHFKKWWILAFNCKLVKIWANTGIPCEFAFTASAPVLENKMDRLLLLSLHQDCFQDGYFQISYICNTTQQCNDIILRRQNHTWYLSFFLHEQNFWRIKFTLKNANFSR